MRILITDIILLIIYLLFMYIINCMKNAVFNKLLTILQYVYFKIQVNIYTDSTLTILLYFTMDVWFFTEPRRHEIFV